MQNNKKYLLTLWQDIYDYDGLTNHFEILGEYADKAKAIEKAKEEKKKLFESIKSENEDWEIMDISGKEKPGKYLFATVNDPKLVIDCISFKLGDESDFNSIYSYIEIVEIDKNRKVDRSIFNTKSFSFEVDTYFKSIV